MEIIGCVGAGLCRWLVSFKYCWWNPPLQHLDGDR